MKGRCVICARVAKLTRDHVPPRGTVRPSPIVVRRLTDMLGGDPAQGTPRPGYQAPTFPSLCESCNVHTLGSLYDPELIAFTKALAVWMRAAASQTIVLPRTVTVSVHPQSVARAVVGHLLAAEERADPVASLIGGSLPIDMRAFFLKRPDHVPAFRIFVWPYLGTDIVIVRGFGLTRVLGRVHAPVVGDVLKFPGLAFWVVGLAPPEVSFPFAELALDRDDEVELHIPLDGVPPPTWPEQPLDDEVVALVRERSHVAQQSSTRRRVT